MIKEQSHKQGIIRFIGAALAGALLLAACQSAAVQPTATEAPPTATQPPPADTAVPATPTEELPTNALSVGDQEIVDNSVIISSVASADQGWVVIHADQDGAPGAVIGFAPVAQGESMDVVVEIDRAAATEALYAMLHVDAGTAGTFEFPGEDAPAQAGEQAVMQPFAITGGLAVEPAIQVEDQDIAAGSITIPQADLEGPGWVVIHIQVDGAPGPVIGHSPLSEGRNNGVQVSVDPAQATETLYAMLHVDAGTVGTYEFPGEDTPLSVGDQMLVMPFNVTGLPPSVIVLDQDVEEDSVTVRQVVSEGAGWIVIHSDDGGNPGPVIGYAPVEDGVNAEVRVEIDESDATDTLHAMLHTDAGTAGTYEFPGDDVPVMFEDVIVMRPFSLSAQASAGPGTAASEVTLVDFNFEPDELTIKAGTTVVFKNTGSQEHTVTADDRSFTSGGLATGDTFEFTFTEPGEYPYYCEPHGGPGGAGMSGVIIVTP